MSNRELPMMPWFPKEFMAATSTWSFAERSAYRALLDVQWELGVLPEEPWRLAQAIGMPIAEFADVWPMVRTKFPKVEGGIRNERLEEHRLVAFKKKQGQKAGADATNAKKRADRGADRDAERDANRTAQRDSKRVASGTHPSPSPSSEEPLTPQSGESASQGGNGKASPRALRVNPRALGTNPRAVAEKAAEDDRWAQLRERAHACGFRDPRPADTPETYETSLRLHERDQHGRLV